MLGGEIALLQATMLDGQSFGPFALFGGDLLGAHGEAQFPGNDMALCAPLLILPALIPDALA